MSTRPRLSPSYGVVAFAGACLLAGAAAAGAFPAYDLLPETASGSFTLAFTVAAPNPWPPGAEARIVLDAADADNLYFARLTDQEAGFVKVVRGREEAVGVRGKLPPSPAPYRMVIKRRPWGMTLYANGQLIAQAYDDQLQQGRIGSASSAQAVQVQEVLCQELGDLFLADDFMREQGDAAGWHAVSGDWQNAVPEGPSPQPNWAANPFTYRCSLANADEGVSVTGYWFWDDYVVEASAKPGPDGAVGLVANYQDPHNYLLFRWSGLSTGSGRKQLLRVTDGRWQVLSQADGGYTPDRWYRLGLRVADGRIEALVDGRVVVTARDTTFGEGQVGLYAGWSKVAHFDDVLVQPYPAVTDSFVEPAAGRWQSVAGKWETKEEHLYGTSGGAQPAVAMLAPATCTDRSCFEADVKPKGTQMVGLRFCAQPNGDCYAFRWQAGGDGKQQLVRVQNGQSQVLAEAAGTRAGDAFSRLGLSVDDGYVAATVNGAVVLEAVDGALHGGKAGVETLGGQACFDDVALRPQPALPAPPVLTEQFTKEDSMSGWARPEVTWRPGGDNVYYERSLVFGDWRLEGPDEVVRGDGRAIRVLCSEQEGVADGTWCVRVRGGADSATVEIEHGGKVIANGAAPLGAQPGRLRVERRGSCLVASVDGHLAAWCRDPDLRAGRMVGLSVDGGAPNFGAWEFASPNLRDYTFSAAPVDWDPQQGIWEITDRWACTGGWAWYGGSQHEQPIVWLRPQFLGDLDLQAWACIGHPYGTPSDVNTTICGDGKALNSGYGLIYGGDRNTVSKITRGDQAVVNNPNILFPADQNVYHHHWFELHIRKVAGHLSYWVDGQLIGEYDDPAPLHDGRVAFWTANSNRLLLSRVRISAQEVQPGG